MALGQVWPAYGLDGTAGEGVTDIPKDKNYPPGAGQCDDCGGPGCESCSGRGWLPPVIGPEGLAVALTGGARRVRKCMRGLCAKELPPDHVAVYCSNECAAEDA